MLYLLLAISCTVVISILVKINEKRGVNTVVVLASNYISASLLGWALAFFIGFDGVGMSTILLGAGGGLLWPGTFLLIMWSIRGYGLALTGSISRLSLSVPVVIALVFLGERLTLPTALGLAATFAAFFFLSPARRTDLGRLNAVSIWFFPLLVVSLGTADFWVNLFNKVGAPEQKFLFITLIFTFSALFCWTAVALRRERLDGDAIRRGLLLGVLNYFSTFFLLETLRTPLFADNSAVAYSLYSIAGVALLFAAGAIFWRERVTRLNVAGLALVIAAVILLNLG